MAANITFGTFECYCTCYFIQHKDTYTSVNCNVTGTHTCYLFKISNKLIRNLSLLVTQCTTTLRGKVVKHTDKKQDEWP